MKTKASQDKVSTLQQLKEEFSNENNKELEAMMDVIEILESDGDREEASKRLHDSVKHSRNAISLLDEIEKVENSS